MRERRDTKSRNGQRCMNVVRLGLVINCARGKKTFSKSKMNENNDGDSWLCERARPKHKGDTGKLICESSISIIY